MENELRPLWKRYFKFNWKFGAVLLLALGIPRFILVLNAKRSLKLVRFKENNRINPGLNSVEYGGFEDIMNKIQKHKILEKIKYADLSI